MTFARSGRILATIGAVLALTAVLAGVGHRLAARHGGSSPRAATGRLAVRVRSFGSSVRLASTSPLPAGGTTVAVSLARNSREGGQLAVETAAAESVSVTPGVLTGSGAARGHTLPASDITVYSEQPLRVTDPSPGEAPGTYFDPLLPLSGRTLHLRAGGRSLLWVDALAPASIVPGNYAGRIVLQRTGGDRSAVAIEVKLHVAAATLPQRPWLGSSVGVDASQIERFEHVRAGTSAQVSMFERYVSLLAQSRLSTADLDVSTDFVHNAAEQTAVLAMATQDGAASVRVPFYGNWPFAHPYTTDRASAVSYLRQVAQILRAHGLIDRAYVYAIDEPDASQAANVATLHAMVHQADAGLRLLVTTNPQSAFTGNVDIWAANISDRFNPQDVATQHAAGKLFWWYPSISTHPPYPTLFLDDTRDSAQAIGPLSVRYGIDGVLYWSATHWQDVGNPWTTAGTYSQDGATGNGDGTLVYPGAPVGIKGPVPSLRLVQLRDGLEDADLAVAGLQASGTRQTVVNLLARYAPDVEEIDGWPGLDALHNRLVTLASSIATTK